MLLMMSTPAFATDELDLSVALKTLPLLITKLSSPASVAVIYDPANPESKNDAEKIKSMLDMNPDAPGDLKLVSFLLSVSELGKLKGAAIAFVAQPVSESAYPAIRSAASAAGVLTICTNIACVKANACVLGVISKPQVDVYYSPAAAEAAHISFASAFTMLVKQIGSL
jgi:hypothetical protein